MLTGIYGVNMLLYHVHEKPEHAGAAGKDLAKLKADLFDIGIVKTQVHCEQGTDFGHSFERFIRENKPDMIVMGITGRNKAQQTFVGSNTLKIARKNFCPVIIVPAGAKFNKLKNIALASDFVHAPSPVVAGIIKNLLSGFFARLHIVNINPAHHVSITEAYQRVRDAIDESFKGYEHEFHFIGLYDLPETMNMFVDDHDIDMIITMPKDHTRLDTLLGNTNTKRMGYHSTVPVVAIHE